MKIKIITTLILVLALFVFAVGQVTEPEPELREKSTDTHQYWKFGGVTAVNLAQTSLINWAAGGQNSIAVMVYSAFLQTIKKISPSGIIRSILAMAFSARAMMPIL